MAAGPALSVLFQHISFSLLGTVVNELTAPGWLMTALWLLYATTLIITFQEPRHYNLRTEDKLNKLLLTKVETEGLLSYDTTSYGSLVDLERDMVMVGGGGGGEEERKSGYWSLDDARRSLLRGEGEGGGGGGGGGGERHHHQPFPIHHRHRHISSLLPHHHHHHLTLHQALLHILERKTGICLWSYFLLKLIQEALFSSAPLVTTSLYGGGSSSSSSTWPDWGTGTLFALICTAIIPTNWFMAHLSLTGVMTDNHFLLLFQALSIISLLTILRFPQQLLFHSYPPSHYILGLSTLYLLMNALEVVVLSLLSKVLSRKLRGTTLNAGLLATEAGTFGRVVADAGVAVRGGGGSGGGDY